MKARLKVPKYITEEIQRRIDEAQQGHNSTMHPTRIEFPMFSVAMDNYFSADYREGVIKLNQRPQSGAKVDEYVDRRVDERIAVTNERTEDGRRAAMGIVYFLLVLAGLIAGAGGGAAEQWAAHRWWLASGTQDSVRWVTAPPCPNGQMRSTFDGECLSASTASTVISDDQQVLTAATATVTTAASAQKTMPPTPHVLGLRVKHSCWLSVDDLSPAKRLFGGTVPEGWKHDFVFAERVSVRTGCPGKTDYKLDGVSWEPVNQAKTPDKAEVVDVTVGTWREPRP